MSLDQNTPPFLPVYPDTIGLCVVDEDCYKHEIEACDHVNKVQKHDIDHNLSTLTIHHELQQTNKTNGPLPQARDNNSLLHTVPTFYDTEKEAFRKPCGKRRKCW